MRRYISLSFLITLMLCGCDITEYPYYLPISEIDYLVVRYHWTTTSGSDLDTRTALVDPPRNIDLGWSRASVDGDYMLHQGDNTSGSGYEAVLVNINKVLEDYPGQDRIDIRLRAFWFGTRGNGNYSIEFVGYRGGEMVQDGFNWVNEGGDEVRRDEVQRNAVTSTSSDVDGDDAGLARYNPWNKALNILDP